MSPPFRRLGQAPVGASNTGRGRCLSSPDYSVYQLCVNYFFLECWAITKSTPRRIRTAIGVSVSLEICFRAAICFRDRYTLLRTLRGMMPDRVHALLSHSQSNDAACIADETYLPAEQRRKLAMSVEHNGRGEPTRNTELAKSTPLRGTAFCGRARSYDSRAFVTGGQSARCFSSRVAASCRSRSATILYLSKTERVLWPEIAMATRSGTPARTKFRGTWPDQRFLPCNSGRW